MFLRALIFVLVTIATANVAQADSFGAWVITFQDSKEAMLRCHFPPARLWISKQSAVIHFNTQLAKVMVDFSRWPAAELSFNLKDGDDILMSGSFDAIRGTWEAPTLSCEGTWTARRTMDLPAPKLVELKLKTTSGACPEDMPPARVWFQAQQPLSVEDAPDRSEPYRRVALIFLSFHAGEYLLETSDGEHLHLWWSGGSLPERSEWTSLSRECKGTWTMMGMPQ